ncbi:MAG: Nicotinate phosphoribosyltransferase pncB2 [Legionellaceae bacterium]
MSILKTVYKTSLALLTDFYQITMAYGYWKEGIAEQEAVFHLFFRNNPFKGGYSICAGLATAIEYLQDLAFDDDDIVYLASLNDSQNQPLFNPEFLNYLKNLQFDFDIDAIEEGTVVFPQEPLLRVKGPLLQCQLLETTLLNIINFQTLIATRAARICYAAQGEPVLEFGLRRAQGFDGGITASRAAYLGGCAATSNVLAGKLYNIPVRGTHAHSWIMSFDTELESFKAYADALPNQSIFLVDTYNSLEGTKHAIKMGNILKRKGHQLMGIRLDSGDLAYLSIEARKLLDEAGFHNTVIVGSNDLDEHIIADLKAQGARINVWGVGTKLATAFEQPALNGIYKLSALRKPNQAWNYKIKLSEQAIKVTTPGVLNVRRFIDKKRAIADAIYDENLGLAADAFIIDPSDSTRRKKLPKKVKSKDLLVPIFRKGKLVYSIPALEESRHKTIQQLKQFHSAILRFLNPHEYPVGLEEHLHELKTKLILKAKGIK